MATFRFRAAIVLELRTRQERDAATARARADAALREAQARADNAARARQQAQAAGAKLGARGATAVELDWHRNWIARLASDLEQRRTDVELRARALTDAERHWQQARQRRLAIERMRDRAWQRFQRQQDRDELKTIDETARMRHGAPPLWGESS